MTYLLACYLMVTIVGLTVLDQAFALRDRRRRAQRRQDRADLRRLR